MKLAIVAAYYNRKPQCIITLNTIALSKASHEVEVILVDDGSDSDHDLSDIIKNYPFKITLIKVPKEIKTWHNPVIGYNIGIVHAMKMTDTEWIILQNPEVCHIGDICISVLNKTDPNLYYVYSVFATESEYINPRVPETNYDYNTTINAINGRTIPGTWYNHPIYAPRKYHFCCAIHRTKLEKIGGFNGNMKDGIAYDDNEILARIERICTSIYVDDMCMGIHLWHPYFSLHGNQEDVNMRIERNKAMYHNLLEQKELIYVDPNLYLPSWDQLDILSNIIG
jgi:hypothetical protein